MILPDLEKWFEKNPLPDGPLQLSPGVICLEPKKMLKTHVDILKAHPKNKTFLPYFTRLNQLQKAIK